MAVSYVGVTSGNSAGGTSTSFITTLPAGWAAGDVGILTGHVRGASLTMSTPAGWTLLPGPTWPINQGANSRAYGWYRVLQAGDTPPTITNSGAMTGGWSMTVYRGADTSSPIGQVGTSTVSATSLTMPTLTGVLAGSALAAAAHAGVSTGTVPNGLTFDAAYTEVVDHATSRATTNANQRMAAAYRLVSSAGNYGGETVTVANAITASMVAVLVEVEQAAAATTVTGSVSLLASGDLSAAPLLAILASATVTASAALTVTAAVRQPAGGSVAASGALTASGSVLQPASAVLAASGALTASSGGSASSSGALAAASALTASGVVLVRGAVSLAAGGVLAAGAQVKADGGSGLFADGGLVASAQVFVLASADLAGASAVSVLSADGGPVVRPDTGAVTRPAVGATSRPDGGVVVRVTGVVVRPDAGVVLRR